MRLQAFGYIIHGATGIWFFSYARMYSEPRVDRPGWTTAWAPGGDTLYTVPPEDFVNKVVPISNELASVLPFLEGPTVGTYWRNATPCGGSVVQSGAQISMVASAGDMQYMLKFSGGKNLLIAMNASDQTASVAFNLGTIAGGDSLTAPARAAQAARRVSEPDSVFISVTNRVFEDSFAPWSVKWYELRAPARVTAAQ